MINITKNALLLSLCLCLGMGSGCSKNEPQPYEMLILGKWNLVECITEGGETKKPDYSRLVEFHPDGRYFDYKNGVRDLFYGDRYTIDSVNILYYSTGQVEPVFGSKYIFYDDNSMLKEKIYFNVTADLNPNKILTYIYKREK